MSAQKTPWSVVYDTLTEYARNDLATNIIHAQIRDWITDLVVTALEDAGMITTPASDGD